MAILRYPEHKALRKTPYQITTLFKYHKEYNPHIFGNTKGTENGEAIDDIDIAFKGL